MSISSVKQVFEGEPAPHPNLVSALGTIEEEFNFESILYCGCGLDNSPSIGLSETEIAYLDRDEDVLEKVAGESHETFHRDLDEGIPEGFEALLAYNLNYGNFADLVDTALEEGQIVVCNKNQGITLDQRANYDLEAVFRHNGRYEESWQSLKSLSKAEEIVPRDFFVYRKS